MLGIAHKEAVWRRVPSLTFIALHPRAYNPDFYNHYLFGWEKQPEEVKIPFLKDIRLQGFKGSTYPDNLILKQCNGIIYEYDFHLPLGRYYYTSNHLFYQGNNFAVSDISLLHGSSGLLGRILRTALFVNVTLPSMADLSQKLKDSLGSNVYEIQKMRMDLFDTFSKSEIKSSHAKLHPKIESNWDIIRKIDRIDEIQKGFSNLVEYIKQPFTPTISHSSPPGQIQDTSNKNEHPCLDLFHFHKTFNVVNDGDKAREYIRDIVNNLQSIEINQRRFENEISNISSLLESRRTLLKDRENTLVAIIFPALGAFLCSLILWRLWPW